MPRVSWTKPRFLYWRDLKAGKSEDVAALMIQNQWHAYKARQFMMSAGARSTRSRRTPDGAPHVHERAHAQARLQEAATVRIGGTGSRGHEPLGHLSAGRVLPAARLWVHRAGTQKVDVDGALLPLSFEWQDYVDLGFTHVARHQLRVLLQDRKKGLLQEPPRFTRTLVRRDRLRYHHRVEKAAISIQRRYRHLRRCKGRAPPARRVEKAKKKAEKDRKEGGLWWSGKIKNLPVPDHGKVYGNRTVRRCRWGSWIGERWCPRRQDAAAQARASTTR